MKRFIAIAAAVGLLAAMSFLIGGPLSAATDETMPAADAQAVWTYITETNPYTEWPPFPGHEGLYPGESPHGAYLKLYVNKPALLAIAAMKTDLPEGAILVKENYAEDRETLVAVTPMYKVGGYNPEGGDWFWAKYGADGQVAAEGKVASCIDCHRSVKDNDWIFTKPQ
jgi:hypothetical protein